MVKDDTQRRLLLFERRDRLEEPALMIACHKSAKHIRRTLEAAVEVFKPDHIFVCDNGDSKVPLDHTKGECEAVSREYVVCFVVGAE